MVLKFVLNLRAMASPLQVPDDDVSIYSLVSCSAVLMAVGFFSLSWSIGLSETWRGLSEGFKWTQTYIKEQGLTWNRSQSKPLQQVLPDQAWTWRKVFFLLSCSHPLLFVFQWQSCGIGKEDEMKSARKHRRLVWLPSVNLADLPPKHTRCVSLVSRLMQFRSSFVIMFQLFQKNLVCLGSFILKIELVLSADSASDFLSSSSTPWSSTQIKETINWAQF